MIKGSIDCFRAALIVFMMILLFLAYRFVENGRYQQVGPRPDYVIDTRTGTVYKTNIIDKSTSPVHE